MAKFHARPSAQYRYEHYDPRMAWARSGATVWTAPGPAGAAPCGAPPV